MSVNFSSSTNDSLFVPLCSELWYMHVILSFTSILLLPLSAFVLWVGQQRWRQQRSSAAVMSHSDFFTYNIAAIELIGLLEYTLSIYSILARLTDLMWVGFFIGSFLWSGQMLFPILTCVDHYLAVVHPITYLRLRQGGGIRIRNIITVYVWLQGFAGPAFTTVTVDYPEYRLIPSACQMVLFLIIMLFCSIPVLYVLIRPRPGETGRDRVQIHQSKRRAFCTITIIMGVLSIKFGGSLLFSVMYSSPTASVSVKCVATMAMRWCSLPSSLVLPLLFLHRAGKLPGCKHHTESG